VNQRPNTDGIAPRTEPSGDERYRAFLENSTEGIWRLEFAPPLDTSLPIDVQIDRARQHGRLAECNTTMARMYGLARPDELIGRTLDFMLPSPDESARHCLAAIIAAGYTVSDLESTGRDANGGVRHFASTMIGVVVDGHLQRMWGTQRDISDRKRAELALRDSEARLRKAAAAEGYLAAIISSADEAIVSKDLDGIIQWCNAAAERLFEYEAAELIGRPVRMLIPPERQSEEDDILTRLRRGERIERFETIRITKSGRRIDVALTVSPVRDASGTIIGASKIARDLSSQKQASSAQAFLAAIVESSDDAIIAKDLNGIIQSCNTAAERVFGYAANELIGRPVRLLIPQERQDEEDKILASIRRGERVDHFETVRRRRDGSLIDVSLTVSPVLDAAGRIIGVSKIARDITAQKRAAAELAAQQAWFQVTLASIGDAVIASDPQGHVTFMNATAERLTGWSASESEGHALAEVFPIINEQTREPVDNPVTLVMRTGGVIGLANHTVLIARDGVERPIADSAAPIRGVDGSTIGVVLVFRDVTEERRSEEAVAEQREWLATTLESIGDAVIATDVYGRIVFMNRVAEGLTGWAAEAAHGRPCLDVLSVVDDGSGEAVPDPVSRVLAHRGVIALTSHALLRSADGSERPIDESGAPIRNREGRIIGVVLVFRDISERRRVELERQGASAERERLLQAERAARAEAERASRVKDEFLAMVSHELRTPLNAILGWTQLMMRSRHDGATLERGLDIVARNTRLQAQLISDLLDISRIVSGKLQLEMDSVDLRSLVDDAVDTLRQDAAAKQIVIDRQLDDEAGHVVGDAARLQQVLWNLLSNAIKFTPDSGRIEVRLRRTGADTAIAVTDNGAGIRADVLPHIFDRFHQADRSITRRFGGLGLGLSIVKHLVDLHGGSVQAESPGEGRGATFTITLPVTSDRLAAPVGPAVVAPAAGPAAPSLLDSLHVLLVEDEPDTRDFLRRLLEAHGAVVRGAGSADEALAAFTAGPPDVLVSDIGLPDVDGYQLLERIRALETPAAEPVPAIALTAYARDEDRRRSLRAGFQAHVAKPVEATELIAVIAGIVGSLPTSRKLT
jgi:PAS domain S-box-containing protein